MSDPNVDLAARVEKLENVVANLIQNLRANNTDLYRIVDEAFQLMGSPVNAEDLRKRLKEAIGKRDPPGCLPGGIQ
jgi:hypothetical protein